MLDALIGRQLANFRIERALGRGGMTVVYYGWDVRLERPVALKVIDARYRDDPTYARRFVREAQAVAQWRHENIIQIYYAGDEDGLYYFVMEYIDGLDLGAVLHDYAGRAALMPHADVLTLGRAIAGALDYAHRQGIVHRDVKPANVMISYTDRVVLTDFGLALDVAQGTQGQVFGSSHYIAPEQARDSAAACPQSDLYALGVILYEMLTGVVPFDDPSPTAVALQHVTQSPPPPRAVNPLLNAAVEAVLLKALSKAPEQRYPTGAALLDALEAALREPPPAPETLVLPPQRTLSTAGVAETLAWRRTAKPDDSADLLGRQLDEYRLESLLGQGGMARVYRGVDVRLKRWVAIKVIDAPFRSDSDYTLRFEREAQAIAQLEHPHIVRLYRYGEAAGLLYMAMQYIEGADLAYVLRSYREDGEWLAPADALRICREICAALDYAHQKGIIHRDVKPSNIMLDQQGNAILTDFGLALLMEVGTRGEIFGSPHYIAPEQAVSSAAVMPQSDLYALGVILYEMFTGQVPFDAALPLDVAVQHMNAAPPPPRQLRPELSAPLEAVLLKALAKEPAARYPTGAALADALEHALHAPATRPWLAQRSIPQQVAAGLAAHPLPALPKTEPPVMQEIPAPPAAVAPPQATFPARETAILPPQVAPQTAPQAVTAIAPPVKPASRGAFPSWGLWALFGVIGLGAALALLVGGFFLVQNLWRNPSLAVTSPLGTPTGEVQVAATPHLTLPAETATLAPTFTPEAVQPETDALPTTAPTATATPTFTPTPLPTPTASPTPAPLTAYTLLLVKQGDDALFLANHSPEPFPLAGLQLSRDKGLIVGTAWGLETLPPGGCLAAVRDVKAIPAPPEGLCSPAEPLAALKRDGPERFWQAAFDIFHAGQTAAPCAKDETQCVVAIPVEATRYLLLARGGLDGLFVIHRGTEPLALSRLRFVKSGDDEDEGGLRASAWGVETLLPGECLVAWKDTNVPETLDGVTCQRVGEVVVLRDRRQQFWRETFSVMWGEERRLGRCEKELFVCFAPESAWP